MTSGGRGRGLFLLPPALVLAFYGFALPRYFTSEDFLLIRFLGQHPPWRSLEAWTGPWLGVTVVKFYRPVSTLLYGLEIAAFGARPLGYNIVHVLLHAGTTLLVFAIARRLVRTMDLARLPGARFVPVAVATLFALYPLHPNAVLFGASFATLWGSGFVLASFLAYLRWREAGRFGPWATSLGSFVLALGSYETAATLPLLLLAHDALSPRAVSARRRVGIVLPFFGVLGLYFGLRRIVFGVFVGGYEDVGARLFEPRWPLWLPDVAASVRTLHAPVFDHVPSTAGTVLVVALVLAAPIVWFAGARHRTGSGALRLWLFSWSWTMVSLAPFAFRPAVPGNGRFWYLAAVGVAMALGCVAAAVAETLPPRWSSLPWMGLTALALSWAWLLAGYLGVYLDAGRTARTIQGELIRAHAEAGAPSRLFVTGYPFFLSSATRTPVAQVFHYGLRDAVSAPFAAANVPVYPLFTLRATELQPIFMTDPRAAVVAWDEVARRFRRVEPSAATLPEVRVLGPRDGALLALAPTEVRLVSGHAGRARLIVVAQGNATVAEPSDLFEPGSSVTLVPPVEFLIAMAHLYAGTEFFWWVEIRDARGRLAEVTRMRSFRLTPPAGVSS